MAEFGRPGTLPPFALRSGQACCDDAARWLQFECDPDRALLSFRQMAERVARLVLGGTFHAGWSGPIVEAYGVEIGYTAGEVEAVLSAASDAARAAGPLACRRCLFRYRSLSKRSLRGPSLPDGERHSVLWNDGPTPKPRPARPYG